MQPVHRTFAIFEQLAARTGRRWVFVCDATPDRSRWYRWLPPRPRQWVYRMLCGIDMALEVARARHADAVLIQEHLPANALPLYFACWIRGRPVFFFVHLIQSVIHRRRRHRLGFRILQYLVRRRRFIPIHLEIKDTGLPPTLRFDHSLAIPHPVPVDPPAPRAAHPAGRVRIGIVGRVRADKPIVELARQLRIFAAAHPTCDLVFATPFWQWPDGFDTLGMEVIDTTDPEVYAQTLASLDIVAMDADRLSFAFRASGIINDAAAAGCLVVAPDLPVFVAQMTTPVTVGLTYRSLAELPEALARAVACLPLDPAITAQWREYRSHERVLQALTEQVSPWLAARKPESQPRRGRS